MREQCVRDSDDYAGRAVSQRARDGGLMLDMQSRCDGGGDGRRVESAETSGKNRRTVGF